MTSEPGPIDHAFVWVWLPGRTTPVVCGRVDVAADRLLFTYGRSYLARPDAIPLYLELPLRPGAIEPGSGLTAPGCLRDAAPDAWGQRVILAAHRGHLDRTSDTGDLGLLTYLLESGSNRVGALDVQRSATTYAPRAADASLDELHEAADCLDAGDPLSEAATAALIRGTSIGGARPKALVSDGPRSFVAKFSSTADTYPVIQAEALGMELARAAGVEVPEAQVIRSLGKDALVVERFDRDRHGHRRMVVSALTMLGLDEMFGRYATYVELADLIRAHFTEPDRTLHELFRRIAVNICIGNTDDHARNHAAFWDGRRLTLTPAYDLCPQPRSGGEAAQAMAYGPDGARRSRLRDLVTAAPTYHLEPAQARDLVDEVVSAMHGSLHAAADRARLRPAELDFLWQRQILNPAIFD